MNTEQREQGTHELAALVRAGIHSGIGAPGHGCLADGALDALLARLRAVEQERDKALAQLHYVPDDWRYAGRLTAAEARVEAAEKVIEAARAVIDTGEDEGVKWVSLLPAGQLPLYDALAEYDRARAVLAPSQQEEK